MYDLSTMRVGRMWLARSLLANRGDLRRVCMLSSHGFGLRPLTAKMAKRRCACDATFCRGRQVGGRRPNHRILARNPEPRSSRAEPSELRGRQPPDTRPEQQRSEPREHPEGRSGRLRTTLSPTVPSPSAPFATAPTIAGQAIGTTQALLISSTRPLGAGASSREPQGLAARIWRRFGTVSSRIGQRSEIGIAL